MRYLTLLLTLLFLSCATHRRTVSTASTAKTVVEAASTITENRDTENRDTTTLHLHTITYTARDTIHRTDTIHRDIYLTTTRYWQLRNDYQRLSADTASVITDTVTRTDTITRTVQATPTTTHGAFRRLITVLIVCLIAAIAAFLGNYIAAQPKK